MYLSWIRISEEFIDSKQNVDAPYLKQHVLTVVNCRSSRPIESFTDNAIGMRAGWQTLSRLQRFNVCEEWSTTGSTTIGMTMCGSCAKASHRRGVTMLSTHHASGLCLLCLRENSTE